MTCPHEDAVVARLLDGDVHAAGVPELDLPAHASLCAACRSSLARSRHLDALVASTATRADDARATDRILHAALAQHAPPPVAMLRPQQRRRVVLAAAAAVLLGAGFVLGRTFTRPGRAAAAAPGRTVAPVADGAVADVADPPAGPAHDPHLLLLPATVARAPAARPEPSPTRALVRSSLRRETDWMAAALFAEADFRQAHAMHAHVRALTFGWPRPDQRALADSVLAAQLGAGRALLDADSLTALSSVARRCEVGDDLAGKLLALAAQHRAFGQRLRQALRTDGAWALCRLAVRLGQPGLDHAVRERARREPAGADAVADACATAVAGVDRVGFLLDLWSLVQRHGDDGVAASDEHSAAAWFRALPPPATDVLLAELQHTRSAEVREQVLLALAARRDPRAVPALLAWIEAPSLTFATLAAYALGCMPATSTPRLEAMARTSRRPELLWAAIVGQGAPSNQARLRAAGLPPAEVALLAGGGFRPTQITAVAALLRGRSIPPASNP